MEKVTEIKAYLETSIEEIVQHQNLLERKLTDQCKDIARRRAELDELPEVSQAEIIIESFDDGEEHYLNQHDNVPGNLDEACKLTPCQPPLCEPVPDADVASMHNSPAVDAELLVPSLWPAFCAKRDGFDIPLSPPSRLVPLSVTSSVFGAAGLEVTSGDSHTITFKILMAIRSSELLSMLRLAPELISWTKQGNIACNVRNTIKVLEHYWQRDVILP